MNVYTGQLVTVAGYPATIITQDEHTITVKYHEAQQTFLIYKPHVTPEFIKPYYKPFRVQPSIY